MPRLSKLVEKLEDRLAVRFGSWYERHKSRVPAYAALLFLGWYLYGMLLNSLKLGKASVFNTTGEAIEKPDRGIHPIRTGCFSSHCFAGLSDHQKGIQLVFRLQIYPRSTGLRYSPRRHSWNFGVLHPKGAWLISGTWKRAGSNWYAAWPPQAASG